MHFAPFQIARLPRLFFGEGSLDALPGLVAEYGRKVLLVTGARSLRDSSHWQALTRGLEHRGVGWAQVAIADEPSPERVDAAVRCHGGEGFEVVVGLGGGSVLDAAKAIAGLLPSGRPVLDFLEDVGRGLPYQGPALPFIAVPTSAGTGSEATKNAVLSMRGADGYKKSFRHELLVAQAAVVDPRLLASCPPELIAAQGMDAFTQLLESYVSRRANPFTDALAASGLEAVAEGFLAAWEGGDSERARHGRAAMAYAALLSGITLAQAGLGSVHGLAQPFGALFPIPHGVACGTTVAAATRVNVLALEAREPHSPALGKYARVGRLLCGAPGLDDAAARAALVATLEAWTVRLALPRLGCYGVCEADIPRIVAGARGNSMKTNPVELTDAEIGAIVRARL